MNACVRDRLFYIQRTCVKAEKENAVPVGKGLRKAGVGKTAGGRTGGNRSGRDDTNLKPLRLVQRNGGAASKCHSKLLHVQL